jgi:hypothetical protein
MGARRVDINESAVMSDPRRSRRTEPGDPRQNQIVFLSQRPMQYWFVVCDAISQNANDAKGFVGVLAAKG